MDFIFCRDLSVYQDEEIDSILKELRTYLREDEDFRYASNTGFLYISEFEYKSLTNGREGEPALIDIYIESALNS